MNEHLINQDESFESAGVSNNSRDKAVFVTGATGLVGSHLIQELADKGRYIKAMYRSNIPDTIFKDKVEWIKGDILDVVSLKQSMQNVQQLYHCAAIVSFDPRQKEKMFATNIEGTANVVNASLEAGVEKLCYVSSVAALGQLQNEQEISENIVWSEDGYTSNYAKSKYLAEMEVWRGIGEGLKAVIVNPSIVLGAGNWNEGSTKIFKTAFEEFPWYTEGETGFVDIKDVVRIMVQLTDSDISGERFIVSAENKEYKHIFSAIANAFGKKPPHKKATPFISEIVWRLEALKSMFTNEACLLTKETARAAQTITKYSNSKIHNYFPSFNYTPLDVAIKRICVELQQKQMF